MSAWLEYAATGATFGLTGGLTPGPTNTLVLAQSLRHGTREGLLVAISPLLTDGPLVATMLWIVGSAGLPDRAVGALALAGAAVVAWLGVGALRAEPPTAADATEAPRSLVKGVLSNFFNPHPWLFWSLVGPPVVAEALRDGGAAAVAAFLVTHYGLLVGTKCALAVVAGRGRRAVRGRGRGYVVVLRVLGLALLAFSLLFLRLAWQRLG